MQEDHTLKAPAEVEASHEAAGQRWSPVMGEYDQETSTAADVDGGRYGFGDVALSTEDLLRQVSEREASSADYAGKAAVAALKREYLLDIKRMVAVAENPLAPRAADGGVLLIGLDAEWQQLDQHTNWILSVQLYVPKQPCFRSAAGGDSKEQERIDRQIAGLSRILYTTSSAPEDRPRLKKALIAIVTQAIEHKLIEAEPQRVEVINFGGRFDLPALGDFTEIKTQIDCASGHLMTVHSDTSIVLDWGEVHAEREAQRKARDEARAAETPLSIREAVVLADGAGCVRIDVRFIDTMAYVPPGTSLRAVGEMIGLEKLDIPAPYSIERMADFLQGDKTAYEAYAMRDAEIAVRYFMQIQAFATERLGIKRLPATASGMAQAWFLAGLKDEAWMKSFGLHRVRREYYDHKKGRYLSKAVVEPTEMRSVWNDLLTRCYHGGRNECLTLGPTDPALGTITDFDLAGAYTTGLVDVPAIDFESPEPSKNLDDFLHNKVGFALVEFVHPPGMRVPVLPVRDGDRGLIFPMRGESYATAPEIQVAHALGVQISVRVGVYYPTVDTNKPEDRLFYPFVRRVREMRDEFKREERERATLTGDAVRKSLKEQLVKLLGNSVYGRVAQGLRPRTAYDARGKEYVELRPSAISNPAIAAHITGFVRAVLAEILNRIPSTHVIASVTTDGFLTSADVEDIDLSGPLCQRYQALCDWVLPGSQMLEVKHRVGQVLAIKTRGQLTTRVEAAKPEFLGMVKPLNEIVLAKAGVQPQVEITRGDSSETLRRKQNEALLDMYLNRTPESQVTVRSFPAIRDQIEKGAEMIKRARVQRMSLEPDIKRRLVNPRELLVASRGVTHLAADSLPWNTLVEFQVARTRLDRFRRQYVLRTVKDFMLFESTMIEALARLDARSQGRASLNVGSDGPLGMLRRAFLRARAKGALGVSVDLKGSALAERLTTLGIPTNAQHVKDAGRAAAQLIRFGVPRTPEVLAVCSALVEAFPGVDVEQLLIPNDR